jgi:hypothetical protein
VWRPPSNVPTRNADVRTFLVHAAMGQQAA